MLVSLGLCLPSATTSDVSLFGTDDDPVRIETCKREYVVLSGFK